MQRDLDQEYEAPSQGIELTSEVTERIKSHFKKRFTVMKAYRDLIDSEVEDQVQLYNMHKSPREYEWQSNIFVPYIYILIHRILPRLMSMLLADPNYVQFESQTEEFLSIENKLSTWFNGKLRQLDFKKIARTVMQQSFKYPMGILKVRWLYQAIYAEIRRNMGMASVRGTQLEIFDDPVVDVVNFFDFWWDPAATSINNARDLCHKVERDYQYLKKMEEAGIYKNTEQLQYSSYPTDSKEKKARVDIYDFKQDSQQYRDGYNPVEIVEYYGQIDLGEKYGVQNVIVTFGNQDVILKAVKNPLYNSMKPFVLIKPLPEDNQFTGMPYIKILSDQQEELNTVRRQRTDNRNLQLRKIWKARKYADIDVEQVVSGPGQIMWLDDMDDVQEFPVKDVIFNAAEEEKIIKNDMQQIGQATETLSGTSPAGSQTATESSILTSESTTQIFDIATAISDQFVELFDIILMMFKQFKESDEYFRTVVGKKPVFEKIPLRAMQGKYFLTYKLKKMSKPTTEKMGVYTNLLNIVGRFPFINVPALVKSTLEAFEIKNVDEIMDAEGFAKKIKAQLAQQMAAQGGGTPEGMAQQTPEDVIGQAGTLNQPMNSQVPPEPVQAIPGAQQVAQTKRSTGVV